MGKGDIQLFGSLGKIDRILGQAVTVFYLSYQKSECIIAL
jgi:hypothetical protein